MNEIHRLQRRYLENIVVFRGLSPHTARGYKHSINAYLKFASDPKASVLMVSSLSKLGFEEWIRYGKLERNWSPKNIKNHMKAWVSFLDWMIAEEIIEKNYMRLIPVPKQPKTLPKYLSKEEAIRLMDWTKNYPYDYKFEKFRGIAIIATFIFTGVRKSELRDLKMVDVDVENQVLHVRLGKCSKDRIIPLNLSLIELLEDYLKERKRLNKHCPYFFTSLRKDSQMGENVIKRLVSKLRAKSKINFYPHLLRHTFATLMLEGGCDIFSLSKMMGHSDIKTTTIYLSATAHHLQEQIIKHPLNL